MREAGIGIDKALARLERNTVLLEAADKSAGYQWRENRRVTAVWKMYHRAVLGNYAVHETKLSGNATKIAENTAGYQQHCYATPTRYTDGVQHVRIQPIIARDRAVVVQRQNREFHCGSCSTA